ncbi:MAG: aminotransferase class V-fold PLP-dependent enzyme [Verrucomicrobiota bacterium]
MPAVFLDHQSSTPPLPEVVEAMRPFLAESFGNAASFHRYGQKARAALNRAREQLASFLHAESAEQVIFTSGGTEAVNLAVKGVAWANVARGRHIVLSGAEHPAVANSVAFLETIGFTATRVPVDREGFISVDDVQAALTDETILICAHYANHDVGTIQPVGKIAEVAAGRGVPLFVDAVAAAGWLPLDVQQLGVSLLALSPHRFYGPKGVGALYRHRGARLVSLIHGGDQEQGRRAGTENVGHRRSRPRRRNRSERCLPRTNPSCGPAAPALGPANRRLCLTWL